jgi:hypothetical protein
MAVDMQTGTMLRPMSLAELLDAGFGVYRRQFVPLVMVALVTQSIPLALNLYVEMAGGALVRPMLALAGMIAAVVLASIGQAASTFIVAETYLGGSITPGAAMGRATPFMGRLIAASFLSALLWGVGFILLIIPGLIIVCGLAVAAPAIVLENLPRATNGLSRSWNLTKGFRFKVFLVYVVSFLLIFLPAVALGGLGMAAATQAETVTGAAFGMLLVVTLLQLLAYPFFYVMTTLMYYDFRVRKEAYDLEMLSSSLGAA